MLDFSINFCVFAHFVCLEGAYVGPVWLVSREGTRERGCCLVMLIKLIVRVRHALMTYPQQSYDVSVHVYTYTKIPSTQVTPVQRHGS